MLVYRCSRLHSGSTSSQPPSLAPTLSRVTPVSPGHAWGVQGGRWASYQADVSDNKRAGRSRRGVKQKQPSKGWQYWLEFRCGTLRSRALDDGVGITLERQRTRRSITYCDGCQFEDSCEGRCSAADEEGEVTAPLSLLICLGCRRRIRRRLCQAVPGRLLSHRIGVDFAYHG